MQTKKDSAKLLGVLKSKLTIRRASFLLGMDLPSYSSDMEYSNWLAVAYGKHSWGANAARLLRLLVSSVPCGCSLRHFSWPPHMECEVLKSLTKIVELSIFPFSYIPFCYMYVGALLLSTCKFMSGHI